MKLGILYINYTEKAEPIADAKVLDVIKDAYKLVKDVEQNKQLNVSNMLAFIGVQMLCFRGEVKAEKIIFMVNGVECEMRYKKSGKSPENIPLSKDLVRGLHSLWLEEYLGF